MRRNELPPFEEAIAGAPEGLVAVVRRSMQPDRLARYATAREVSTALGQYLHDLDDAVDTSAIEHYLAKLVPPRATTVPPPAPSILQGIPALSPNAHDGAGPHDPQVTMQAMPTVDRPSGPPGEASADRPTVAGARAGRMAEPVAALRERVHVAVVVGRVLPNRKRTGDPRGFFALLEQPCLQSRRRPSRRRGTRASPWWWASRARTPTMPLRAARLALDVLDAAGSMDSGHRD